MLHYLTCQTPIRFVRVAWLSFQPNGDISFGLNDKVFISPKFRERNFIWNAYNRITAEFEIASDPNALEQVKNPHFTFHQPHYFHLKSNKDKARDDAALFAGICDVQLTMMQQPEMPWIRATTSPIKQQISSGLNWKKVPTNDLSLNIDSEDVSIQIGIDFVRASEVPVVSIPATWHFPISTEDTAIRINIAATDAQIATLGWFHSS